MVGRFSCYGTTIPLETHIALFHLRSRFHKPGRKGIHANKRDSAVPKGCPTEKPKNDSKENVCASRNSYIFHYEQHGEQQNHDQRDCNHRPLRLLAQRLRS